MDSLYSSSSNKIPYDDTPIYRVQKKESKNSKNKKTIIFSIFFVVLFVLNIALCITCYTYLQNGKIKVVNIYNDTYSTQNVTYLVESMRAAKSHSVCIAAGAKENLLSPNQEITSNADFFNKTKSHGSGFLYKIVGDTAYFVTCFHVINYTDNETVAQNTRIWVLPASMLIPIEVELVSYSSKDDVAVLKYTHNDIVETLEGCTPVAVYDSTFVSEYEDVFTIGNPLNTGFNGTSGKLSAYRDEYYDSQVGIEYSWMKTDAAINPGNSGGGFYNAKGELIGMVNAYIPKTSTGDPVNNMAYAIPGTLVCSIANNIIENNLKLEKPTAVNLGLTFGVDEVMGIERHKEAYKDHNGKFKDLDQQYVVIEKFDNNSIARDQGLKVGDRIIKIAIEVYGSDEKIEVPILNRYTFYEYAYAIKKGTFITFTLERQNAQNETISDVVSVRATKYS